MYLKPKNRCRFEVHQLPEPEEGRTSQGRALLGSSGCREQGGIVKCCACQIDHSSRASNVPCLTTYDYLTIIIIILFTLFCCMKCTQCHCACPHPKSKLSKFSAICHSLHLHFADLICRLFCSELEKVDELLL